MVTRPSAPSIAATPLPPPSPDVPKRPRGAHSIAFSCSTFMSRGNRRTEAINALRSIYQQHGDAERELLGDLLVINEYDAARREDYEDAVRSAIALPNLQFIQKGPDARGQARTLNMILDRLAGYEFWVHWEESWVCTRPFLKQALDVMESTALTQLQITNDWLDVGEARLTRTTTPSGTTYVRVAPDSNTGRTGPDVRFGWPLYSLRPSINRAEFCWRVGRFDENPHMWPVRFERDFGTRWFRQGATKGVLVPAAAQVQPNHRSTY